MIVIKLFSNRTREIAEGLIEKLDHDGYDDYEIVDRISDDSITITAENKIYIPDDLDYMQYKIEDFLKGENRFIRTKMEKVRNGVSCMNIIGTLTEPKLYHVVKYIIDEGEFVSIMEE